MLARAALFTVAVATSAIAQNNVIGDIRWSADRFTEYVVGNAPILVTAGHGGDLEPSGLPDRTYGTTVKDTRTLELTREFAQALRDRFGLHPHVVLFHLSRKKVDVNRDIVEGAQGDPLAEQAYLAFHQACADARSRMLATWGYGFYFDLHGHGHPEGWVELGYALTASQLAVSDPVLAQPAYVAQSTIRSAGSGAGVFFPALLRGGDSLGAHLQTGGFDSVPSPIHPDPNGGNYFNGGYNVRLYGSLDNLPVDGVQIESPWSVRSSMLVRGPFVARVAGWLEPFFVAYRGDDPTQGGRVTVEAVDRVASETGGRGEFVVRRTGDVSSGRFVTLRWAGSATRGSDYATTPLAAWFAPGADEVRISIDANDDVDHEGDETIDLWLPTGDDMGVPNRAQIVIHDDEAGSDLVVDHRFDAVAGGLVLDGSGNARHGSLLPSSGGPSLVAGRFGNALRFDGVDDRVRLADFSYAPGGDFSLAFWFRTSEVGGSGFRYLLSHGGLATPHRLGVYFDQSTGHLRTGLIYANDLTDLDVLDVSRDLRDGQWHHYALVADADALVQVFVDGRLETSAVFLGNLLDPVGDFVLGVRADLASSTFAEAELDEFRLWNRAITGVEVALLQSPSGEEAMVYPGSGEDLELATGAGAAPTAGPRQDVKHAPPGSLVVASYRSPNGTFVGGVAALGGVFFPTGAPPMFPGLPTVHVPAGVVAHGPIVLTTAGGAWTVPVPAGLAGTSLMLQPIVLHPGASNGLFAIGAAHELRF